MSDEDQKNAQSIRAKQEALEDRETELRQRESDVEYDEKKNKILKRTLIGVSIISVSYTHLTLPTNREV